MLSMVPNLAGLMFRSKMHVLNWRQTNEHHPLFIGRFGNATAPIWDRKKNIVMPNRVNTRDIFTHGFRPLPGYKKLRPEPASIGTHHYRSCRDKWLKKRTEFNKRRTAVFDGINSSICFDFKQYKETATELLAEAITNKVFETKLALDIATT